MKTNAAVLYTLNQPLVVDTDIEIPQLQRGQVLVQIFYSGVCHSQLMEVRGRRGQDHYLPHLLGHEATAEVIAIGSGVTKVKKGDRVILTWIKSSGIEAGGAKYRKGDMIINSGAVTTFSEYSVVSENRCVKLPKGISLDIGSLFGCAVQIGAGIIMNTVQPKKNSTIAVFGVGGIGLSALMAARLYDCSIMIAVDIEEAKLNLARECGATHAIQSKEQDAVREILRITNGVGLDYAVDASGLVGPIEQAFQSVRKKGGLCVFASHPAHEDKIKIDPFDLICGKQIKGSWGGDSVPDRDIPRLAKLYLKGEFPLEKLITRRYALDRVNEALDDIENHQVARALLEINGAKK